MQLLALLFSSVFNLDLVFAAACCGGGFSAPSIIVGDNKAQLSTTYSFTSVLIDNVDTRGIWRKSSEHQAVQTFRIEAAHIFWDRWQTGVALPLMQRAKMGQSYFGLGDASVSLGYEFLTDWDYNPIRPKGLVYFQITTPTGKSKAESENGGLDSRGNGVWALGLGALLSKTVDAWDFFTSLEAHRGFSKSVNNSQWQGKLIPGFGGNFSFGAGYNLKSWRFGTALSWTYESPVRITGTLNSEGAIERYAAASLSTTYLASDAYSGTLSYSDQTLFGSPVNTSLGRSVALQIQRKWVR
jgi:hypothetical protein